MRVLLLGYGGALGSEAQLLAGHGIDFYQRTLLLCLGRPGAPRAGVGCQGGCSILSRALKEKPLGGLAVLEGQGLC